MKTWQLRIRDLDTISHVPGSTGAMINQSALTYLRLVVRGGA